VLSTPRSDNPSDSFRRHGIVTLDRRLRLLPQVRENGDVLDWMNLAAGSVFGFLLGLIPWVVDRVRARRESRENAHSEWAAAAEQLSQHSRKKKISYLDFKSARLTYPIDRWRRVLGPEDFMAVERVEAELLMTDGWSLLKKTHSGRGFDEESKRIESKREVAIVRLANVADRLHDEVDAQVNRLQFRALQRKALRHPIQAFRSRRVFAGQGDLLDILDEEKRIRAEGRGEKPPRNWPRRLR
jgi:hypothetical protein